MKRTYLALAASALACTTLAACGEDGGGGARDAGDAKVCVDQYATATVIDDLLTGIKAGLADAIDDGLELDVQNPNADAATEQTLAQKFISGGCDVIVPVGTSASQLMATATKDIPIVFAASSTPVDAELVASMDEPGGNVTGVADVIDPVPDIDAMKQLIPDLDKVGLIWKLGDPAGDAQADKARAHLDELGVEYVEATISNGSDITQAAQSLVGKVDAIEIPGDTTTISAVEGLMKVADDAKLPVYGGTGEAVAAGAVISSSYDYEVVGKEVATLVLAVLDGADPATTAVVVPETGGFDLNRTKLTELGIDVPAEILDAALTTQ
ncbi:ABC transporter substrate-binding protein [Nocardioides sp. LHD-245]|uniref:ABC transporter substrate-binding protein n=1 Tax=Nocardioides sp. LHD-245 TaxID=3051387 RepID=UPI0027E197AE|nr:ABC transporter substrate-binding protein [Nocardioides sp. LHD-245]